MYIPWLTNQGSGSGRSDLTLKCPVCECKQTHVRGAYTRQGYETLPINHKDTDGFRGDALVIVVEGECQDWFEVVFRQHMGDTFVYYKHIEPALSKVMLNA